eukprot:gene5573-7101_t
MQYCGTTEVMNYAGGFMLSKEQKPLAADIEEKLHQ